MQLPKSLTTVTRLSKISTLVLFVSLPFIGAYKGYLLGKSEVIPAICPIQSLPTLVSQKPTAMPILKPVIHELGQVPVITRQITYQNENTIFLRDFKNNKLSPEKNLVSADNAISSYSVSPNFKYVAYTYLSSVLNKSTQDMGGVGDEVAIKDIASGKSKVILSGLSKNTLVATLSFSPKSDKLFIGLDNNDFYFYTISSSKLVKIYSGSSDTGSNFCRGYYLIDESPDTRNILIRNRCFEGSSMFIFNLNSKIFTKVGGGYGEGTNIIKFLNNKEIYGYSYGQSTKYLKLDLKGNIIQELPTPTEATQVLFNLYSEDGTTFIANELKSRVPNEVYSDNRQNVGTNIKDIKFYPSR